MKQLFHIANGGTDLAEQVLALRVGEQHASFAITSKKGAELRELAYCTAEEWTAKQLEELFHAYPVLANSFNEVILCFDHPHSVIIPYNVNASDEAAALLNLSTGKGQHDRVISAMIPGWQLLNAIAVPRETVDWLGTKFPSATYWHQYPLWMKTMDSSPSGTLRIDFRKDDFTVLLLKPDHFLLAQAFGYATPEDVIYYLLKICREFSLSQQEVELELTGLIDKRSALYKELYQYFIHPGFRESSWKMPEEYPAHFFTSLNDLAICAS